MTLGLVQWSFPIGNHPRDYAAFDLALLAPHLDYLSPHFYPILPGVRLDDFRAQTLRYAEAWIRWCWHGKPVVVEEFGWTGGGDDPGLGRYSEHEQALYQADLVRRTRSSACGWLTWPYADSLVSTDVSRFGGLVGVDSRTKAWGESFRQLSRDLVAEPPAARSPGVATTVDLCAVLTGLGSGHDMYDTPFARSLLAEDVRRDFVVNR